MDLVSLPRLLLREELRLGSVEDPDAGFSHITAVEVAPEGTVFVLDRQERVAKAYSADGRLLLRIGGPGQGPGELMFPSFLQLAGDTVVIAEILGNRRINLFHREGELLATVPAQRIRIHLEDANAVMEVMPWRLRPDGRFDAMYSRPSLPPGRAPGGSVDSILVPTITFDGAGTSADTIGWHTFRVFPPPFTTVGGVEVDARPALPVTRLGQVLSEDTVWATREPGREAGQHVFTVTRIGGAGDTLYHQRLAYTPRPVEAAYRDSVLQARLTPFLEQRGDGPGLASATRTVNEILAWPSYHPPIFAMHVGRDGSVWLQRERDRGEDLWTVLDPNGNARGHVVLPAGATPHWSSADLLWAAVPDVLGVPWLVRYRLEGD